MLKCWKVNLRGVAPARFFTVIILAMSILIAVACGQGDGSSVGRIAYVGVDGNVYITTEDGSHHRRLTEDGSVGEGNQISASYAMPTWSQDGKYLAVSKVTVGNTVDINRKVYLHVLEVESGEETIVYENPPVAVPFIANRVPHYMYWSPDSNQLSFIANASDSQGLTLYLASVGTEGVQEVTPIIIGAPLYWTWSMDQDLLLLHVGDSMYLVNTEDLTVLSEFSRRPTWFRNAGLSAIEGRIAYSGIYAGSSALFVADSGGAGDQVITDVGSSLAFLWSPTKEELAFADSSDLNASYYDGITVTDLSSDNLRVLVEEEVMSFFWSPDGEKIAYATVDHVAGGLRWKVVNRDGTQSRDLIGFVPSQEYLLALSFFDQYAHSNSIWSPDSKHLLLAGLMNDDGGVELASNDQSLIYVLDVEGESPPRVIADGTIAFWSWD